MKSSFAGPSQQRTISNVSDRHFEFHVGQTLIRDLRQAMQAVLARFRCLADNTDSIFVSKFEKLAQTGLENFQRDHDDRGINKESCIGLKILRSADGPCEGLQSSPSVGKGGDSGVRTEGSGVEKDIQKHVISTKSHSRLCLTKTA
jgi:hypothetical protein